MCDCEKRSPWRQQYKKVALKMGSNGVSPLISHANTAMLSYFSIKLMFHKSGVELFFFLRLLLLYQLDTQRPPGLNEAIKLTCNVKRAYRSAAHSKTCFHWEKWCDEAWTDLPEAVEVL